MKEMVSIINELQEQLKLKEAQNAKLTEKLERLSHTQNDE